MLKDSALPFTLTFPCKIKCKEEEENMGIFVHGHQMFFFRHDFYLENDTSKQMKEYAENSTPALLFLIQH